MTDRSTHPATRPVLLSLLLVLTASPLARAQPYTAVDLGVLPGQTMSVATDINNRQQVVGYSGAEAFLWDPVAGLRPLGVQANQVRINDRGIVAGIRAVGTDLRPFAWIDGVVYDVPSPPGQQVWILRELTDNNILVMCGVRCWAFHDGVLYDLDAITGAAIAAVNEQAVLGGTLGTNAYLRFPDGRVVTPWTGAALPATPGPGTVERIGPAGHFAGRSGGAAWYGRPDGGVTPMGIGEAGRAAFTLNDINRTGRVVGTYRTHILLPQLDTAFVYAPAGVVVLDEDVVAGAGDIRSAAAINDADCVAATAWMGDALRAVLLVPAMPGAPSNLSFTLSGRVVSLTWTAPAGAVEYIVEAGSGAGGSDVYVAVVGSQSSLVVAAPPGRYHVRVRARNGAGTSAASNEVVIDVP